MSTAEGCIQILSNKRCGFTLGKAYNEPCYLMRRRVGFTGQDIKMSIKSVNLPKPEEFLSRLNKCGDKVIDKKFCSTPTTAWVWEAYAFRQWKTFEEFEKAGPPYVLATSIGADGIVMCEQGNKNKLLRCKYYKDRDIPYEMRWQTPDTFQENQWSEKIQSWGPNGAILPFVNSTNDWKSLVDQDKIGIVCFFNQIWISSYSWTADSGSNISQNWFEILLRPREIQRTDLIMYLIEKNCSRPCSAPETAESYPCLNDTECPKDSVSLPHFETVKDTDEILLPNGKKVSGKDYKAVLEKRTGYKKPCITTCPASGPVAPLAAVMDDGHSTQKSSGSNGTATSDTHSGGINETNDATDHSAPIFGSQTEQMDTDIPNGGASQATTEGSI